MKKTIRRKSMETKDVYLFPHLTLHTVENIHGFKLCSYLVALEGWRRGLQLTWYKDESELCKLDRMNSSTHGKFYSLSNGEKKHYFFRSRGDKVANKAVRIVQDKVKTKEYLSKAGVPIPLGDAFEEDDDIINYAEKIGYPVIVKPLKGSMGKGVHTNIADREELMSVLRELRARYSYKEYIIEKHYAGNEYRIYVVGDKVIGATNRVPANVIGDGKNNIEQLINLKNKEREKNPYLAPKPIKVDYEVKNLLKLHGYDLESIPDKGERVFLRDKSNLSTGGDPIEATDELSEEVKQIAVNALKALPSIPHAGVDIIVDPNDKTKGVVLEANGTAEIGFHLFPLEGNAKDVPGAIIDYYFPETKNITKSSFYFDYHSILEPLKEWATDEVVISKAPVKNELIKRIVLTGKLKKVGYMNFIRRQALHRGLHGKIQHLDDNTIEIKIWNANDENMEGFIEVCKKGSKKSKVKDVQVSELRENVETPRKLGFHIISAIN